MISRYVEIRGPEEVGGLTGGRISIKSSRKTKSCSTGVKTSFLAERLHSEVYSARALVGCLSHAFPKFWR